MSNKEDLSFLNLPTFKSFKVKSGRTYVQLDEKGHSIAVSFSSWFDEKTADVVTGVIIRPVLRALKDNVALCSELLDSNCKLDRTNQVIRKPKVLYPTHWGFAQPSDVLKTLDDREFFPLLCEKIKEAYEVDVNAEQFKTFIAVSDTAFSNATVKDFREVIDIVL